MNRIVTPALEKRIEDMWKQGLTDVQIGEELWISKSTVRKVRARMGLESKHKVNVVYLDYPNMDEDIKSGNYHVDDLMEKYKCSETAVRSRARKIGYKITITPKPKSCVDYERLYKLGYNDAEIGRATGRGPSAVSRWRKIMGYPSNYDPADKRPNRVKHNNKKRKKVNIPWRPNYENLDRK